MKKLLCGILLVCALCSCSGSDNTNTNMFIVESVEYVSERQELTPMRFAKHNDKTYVQYEKRTITKAYFKYKVRQLGENQSFYVCTDKHFTPGDTLTLMSMN